MAATTALQSVEVADLLLSLGVDIDRAAAVRACPRLWGFALKQVAKGENLRDHLKQLARDFLTFFEAFELIEQLLVLVDVDAQLISHSNDSVGHGALAFGADDWGTAVGFVVAETNSFFDVSGVTVGVRGLIGLFAAKHRNLAKG